MPTTLTSFANAALVGISRKAPAWPEVAGDVGTLLGELSEGASELRLLRTAGILSLAEWGGQEPAQGPAPVEPLAASGAMLWTTQLPAELPGLLARWTSEGASNFLAEALREMKPRLLAPPAIHLPEWLRLSRGQSALTSALAEFPDPRIHFLASRNADWAHVLKRTIRDDSLPDSLWQEGSLVERCAWLRQCRQVDAAKGREALAAVLPQEAAKERLALISELVHGLSADDEPLLESLLGDKGKLVRQEAATLLSRLPQSALATRMQDRLRPMILLTGGKKAPQLDFQLPEAFEPSWAKDGLEEKPPQGVGSKAFWLRQLVSVTPLRFWQSEALAGFADPAAVLQALEASTFAAEARTGLAAAAVSQADVAWAQALLRHPLASGAAPLGQDDEALCELAGTDCTEELILSKLTGGQVVPALQLACNLAAWTPTLSAAIISEVIRSCRGVVDYQFYQLWGDVALKLHPQTLPQALAEWQPAAIPESLHSLLSSCTTILEQRHALHASLPPL